MEPWAAQGLESSGRKPRPEADSMRSVAIETGVEAPIYESFRR